MKPTPKYDNPPVVETVIGVQYPELAGFTASHFGLYWAEIRKRYPKTVDQPRLEPVFESFPKKPPLPRPPIQLAARTIPDRSWFTSASDSELIQLQPDRFLFNWRQREREYPSYEANSNRFLEEFKGFCTFCDGMEGLETPAPNLCEVSYFNHIIPEEGESATDLFADVFTGLSWELNDDWLPHPESAVFNRAYVIEDDGTKVGRLYAEAGIAVRRVEHKNGEFVLFRLTARVKYPTSKRTELASSLRLAHDWVVNGFACLTDERIQKERWKRTV